MLRTILITLLGPMLWGSTYAVFTETLPVSHPLLTGALRALPAGLILLALNPRIPPFAALKRHAVIGFSNIGLFFGLLFVAASRMPGGLAATLGAIQPLVVVLITAWLVGRAPHPVQILAGIAGVIGVGLLVLAPEAVPDPIGVAAASGADGGRPAARAGPDRGAGIWLANAIGHGICLLRLDPRHRQNRSECYLSGACQPGCGHRDWRDCAGRMVQPAAMGRHGAGDWRHRCGRLDRTAGLVSCPHRATANTADWQALSCDQR